MYPREQKEQGQESLAVSLALILGRKMLPLGSHSFGEPALSGGCNL